MPPNQVEFRALFAWAEFVNERLAALDSAYLASNDEDERLHGFAAAFALLLNQCKDLPGFESTVILDDLLLKLTDVLAGTPALQPVKRSGRAKQGWRDAIIQGRACAGVDLLVEHGDEEPTACKIVATALAKAGVRGRKGGPISPATVRDWRSRAAPYGDKEDAKFIRENIQSLRSLIDAKPMTRSQRRRFVASFVSSGTAIGRELSDKGPS